MTPLSRAPHTFMYLLAIARSSRGAVRTRSSMTRVIMRG